MLGSEKVWGNELEKALAWWGIHLIPDWKVFPGSWVNLTTSGNSMVATDYPSQVQQAVACPLTQKHSGKQTLWSSGLHVILFTVY